MKKFFFIGFILLSVVSLKAQNKVDSLKRVIENSNDTVKINALNKYAKELLRTEINNAVDTLDLSIKLAHGKYPEGEALAYKYKGIASYFKGNIDSALAYFNISRKIYEDNKLYVDAARVLNNIGIMQKKKGDLKSALNSYITAIKILEGSDDYNSLIATYINAANILTDIGNFQDALQYNLKALSIYDKIDTKEARDSIKIAHIYKTIANIYSLQNDTASAYKYYDKAFDIYSKYNSKEDIGDIFVNRGVIAGDNNLKDVEKNYYYKALSYYSTPTKKAVVYLNLAEIYSKLQNEDSLFYFYNKAKEIYTQTHSLKGLIRLDVVMGNYYESIGKIRKAYDIYQDAIEKANELGDVSLLKNVYKIAYETAKKMGLYKDALEFHEKYKAYNDSIFNTSNQKKITQLSLTYEFQKQQHEKELLYNEEIKRQKIKQLFFMIIAALAILIILFMFLAMRTIKKKNLELERKNQEILMQKEEIIAQKEEIEVQMKQIEKQRDTIEEQAEEIKKQRDLAIKHGNELEKKNRDIEASIQYALRIQQAMLPDIDDLKNFFADYFLFYKPRDIVSGDFYWFSVIGNKIIIAAADCTGHGVPGAFMSLLGISFLNQIVKEIGEINSAEILNTLRMRIIKTLKQDPDNFDSSKDGMDMSLIVYDKHNNELQYSGAYNSLYLVSSVHPEFIDVHNVSIFEDKDKNVALYEFKADRMPIGVHISHIKNFNRSVIKVNKKDRLYLFSDGFPDLYSYEKNKKFSAKRFKSLFLSYYDIELHKQRDILKQIFIEWTGEHKQIDDILVIGLEV